MDSTVEWEMCELNSVMNQFKSMAGLDYSSMADNLTREVMVIAMDSPEARKQIKDLKDAAACAATATEDLAAAVKEATDGDECYDDDGNYICTQDAGSEENWNFQAESGDDAFSADELEETAKAVEECFAKVDRYQIGEISGKLMSKFFNLHLETV